MISDKCLIGLTTGMSRPRKKGWDGDFGNLGGSQNGHGDRVFMLSNFFTTLHSIDGSFSKSSFSTSPRKILFKENNHLLRVRKEERVRSTSDK